MLLRLPAPVADSHARRPDERTMTRKRAYSQPLRMGKCLKAPGATGKYDDVRRLWEDRITGHFLRPHLKGLVEEKKRRGKGLRILDLGCGAGDGLDLIRGVPGDECAGVDGPWPMLVTDEWLEEYVGIDINEDLLGQALEWHAGNRKARFVRADLSDGLPGQIISEHDPFDLYFSSYAMLSHFRDEQCVRILADICGHAEGHALFVGDWLGHYSYEWQDLWREPAGPDYFMDYRMSYLYAPSERHSVDIPMFPLRLMTRDAILDVVRRASEATGADVRPLAIFDRSILTGRHTDTLEYNRSCPQLRSAVNSLFDGKARTDLKRLLVEYVPREGFDQLNRFFEDFFAASNRLITCTMGLLRGDDSSSETSASVAFARNECLHQSMQALRSVIGGLRSFDCGDARASLIEPMLGYALQHLEIELQPGIGAGHSIGAVLDIKTEE